MDLFAPLSAKLHGKLSVLSVHGPVAVPWLLSSFPALVPLPFSVQLFLLSLSCNGLACYSLDPAIILILILI